MTVTATKLPATSLQKIAGGLAILCAIVTEVMVVLWMKGTKDYYFGGLDWDKLLFNYHPIFMVAGMFCCFISAAVSFRVFPFERNVTKMMHGLLHTCGICFIVIGLTAVFMGNNYISKGGIYPNLSSPHSIIGLITVMLYGSNFLGGLASFGLYEYLGISAEFKAAYLPSHVFIGIFTIFCATMAIETGTMELFAEIGCSGAMGITQVFFIIRIKSFFFINMVIFLIYTFIIVFIIIYSSSLSFSDSSSLS